MASFNIALLYDKQSDHLRAFDDIIALLYHSLIDIGVVVTITRGRLSENTDINIILGAHLVDSFSLPPKSIVLNTEQLNGDIPELWKKRVNSSASSASCVWDIFSSNQSSYFFNGEHKPDIYHLKLGYHPLIQHQNIPKIGNSLGFVHLGNVTPYREPILAKLQKESSLYVQSMAGFYGSERDAIYSQSIAGLLIHSQSTRLLEWPRLNYLLHKKIPGIFLRHELSSCEPYQEGFAWEIDEFHCVQQLLTIQSDPEILQEFTLQACDKFSELDQVSFTQEILDQSLLRDSFHPLVASDPQLHHAGKSQDSEENIDSNWYLTCYSHVEADPRPIALFHKEEGRYRQYHPNPNYYKVFRSPLSTDELSSRLSALLTLEPSNTSPPTLGVVLHFYTHQRARIFFNLFAINIPKNASLMITVADPALAAYVGYLANKLGFIDVFIIHIPNRGRDIPSKYIHFRDKLKTIDLCLFSHGKESDNHWFYSSNERLCGSIESVNRIIDIFAADAGLGLLMPDYLPHLRPSIGWQSMRPMIDTLLSKFLLSTDPITLLEFPAGGFYWARPAALELINSLELSIEDLPVEPIPQDGTILHAIERLPCISAEVCGFNWEKLALS